MCHGQIYNWGKCCRWHCGRSTVFWLQAVKSLKLWHWGCGLWCSLYHSQSVDHTDETDRVATIVDSGLHAPVHTHAVHTYRHAPLQRGVIIFKELFINVFSPGKVQISAEEVTVQYGPRMQWGKKIPGCFTSLLMNIWATQQLTLSDHIFPPVVVVVVVHGVAVMSSSGCHKGSACSCGGSPQSLSHFLFPWQSFRQHHRQAVCKDPYNLFFQQPLLWCSSPEQTSNYQV